MKKLYIALFFALLLIPPVSLAFSGGEFPQLFKDSKLNADFTAEAEEYFESALPVKAELVTLTGFVKSKLFKSESANVVTGRGGWLFYSETTADYLGADRLSGREIFSLAKNISLISEYCETAGTGFVFAAVPNKNSVLGEYMPCNFISGSVSNRAALSAALAGLGVKEAGVYSALAGAEHREDFYFKTDTHWNAFGAYIGFSQIINALQRETPDGLQNLDLGDFEETPGRATDLSALLFPAVGAKESGLQPKESAALLEAIDISVRGQEGGTAELLALIDDKDESFSRIRTTSSAEQAKRKLFMLRDSFCRAMLPYFAYTYKEALFVKSAQFNAYLYDLGEYDDFVFEVVERNLSSILESRQLLPAPERDIGALQAAPESGGSIETNTEYSDYCLIEGEVETRYLTDSSPVYVSLTGAQGETHTYEALLGEVSGGVQAYYLSLPPAAPGQYHARLIAGNTVLAQSEISF